MAFDHFRGCLFSSIIAGASPSGGASTALEIAIAELLSPLAPPNKAKDRGACPARGKSRDKASAPPAGETPQRGQEAPSEGDTAAVEVAAPVGKKGDGVKVSPSSGSGKGVLSKPALKGDASHAKPANKFRDDDAAATAIQSQMRGRQTRAAVAEKTCSPLAASTPALIVFSSHCAPTRTA